MGYASTRHGETIEDSQSSSSLHGLHGNHDDEIVATEGLLPDSAGNQSNIHSDTELR